jgi:hypothetical protein
VALIFEPVPKRQRSSVGGVGRHGTPRTSSSGAFYLFSAQPRGLDLGTPPIELPFRQASIDVTRYEGGIASENQSDLPQQLIIENAERKEEPFGSSFDEFWVLFRD